MKNKEEYFVWIAAVLLVSVLVAIVIGSYRDGLKKEAKRAEKEKTRIVFGDYVKLTILECGAIRDKYSKKDIEGLGEFYKQMITCDEIARGFYLKYSLIRHKQQMYMVHWTWASGKEKAHIYEVNVPYCVIGTDKAEYSVVESCESIP